MTNWRSQVDGLLPIVLAEAHLAIAQTLIRAGRREEAIQLASDIMADVQQKSGAAGGSEAKELKSTAKWISQTCKKLGI